MIDLRIDNAAVVTMDDRRRELRRGSIAINEGKIISVEETGFFPKNLVSDALPPAKKVIDAQGQVALPGLVNTHTHVYQALIEGIGYDMHFDPWNWRFNFPIAS